MSARPRLKVDDLLNTIPAKKRKHALLASPLLAEAVEHFLKAKAAGDPRAHVSLRYFYMQKLQPTFGGPGFDAVRHYVADVLRRNITTGEPL